MQNDSKKKVVMIAILCLVIGGGVGYWYGSSNGFSTGYTTAQEDAKKLAEETAKKAAEEAAKAANPFQVVNPLENVELNPFEKTKKILNPFE